MKDGWEYEKFEDCLLKIPKAKQLKTNEYSSEGQYPIVSQEEAFISGYTDREGFLCHIPSPVVVFGDHTRVLKYVNFDFVVGADGVKILLPKNNLNVKFFYYYLKWYNIPSLGYSRHYKLLKELEIPIPPLSEQHAVVEELDLLNAIIDKKKAELEELDKLAQSIFYDMFGDPVENEKGWEVKKLEEFSKIITGNTPSRKVAEFYSDNFIEWIKSDNISDEILNPAKAKESLSESGAEKGRIAHAGDILVTCIAGSLSSIGTSCVLNRSVAFNQQINAITKLKKAESLFLRYMIKFSKMYFQEFATTGMKHIITKGVFEKIPVILPPLPLQQQFASRISALEKIKEKVTESMTETQTLLAATMDKYFG